MKTVPLRRLCTILNGGTPKAETSNWGGDVPWATPVDLRKVDGGHISETDRSLTHTGVQTGSTLAPAGSVLLSSRAPIGYTAIADRAMAFNQGCKALVPAGATNPRFLQYSLISMARDLKEAGSGSTFMEVSAEAIGATHVSTKSPEEQRRIADFLDDRVSRIDRIIAARRDQLAGLDATSTRQSFDTVIGASVSGRRRDSGKPWLGTIPEGWPLQTVGAHFKVELGKMLNESRQTGDHAIPYLRNANVQWDRIVTDDVKSMDIAAHELARYTVQRGDLLICEGGQPGRAAIWDGRTAPMGFQKALHRARSRGSASPQWLLECLRAATALNVFAVENGQTTIGHLTNDQLRAQRFPFPSRGEQEELLKTLADRRAEIRETQAALTRSIELLTEYKQSLITAAVTGQLDVTTASTRIPE